MTQRLFSDGGLIAKNPSDIGGTWAWCRTDDDQRLAADSGVYVPRGGVLAGKAERWPASKITNNEMELIALVRGLVELPNGWQGEVCVDSQIALGWIFAGFRCRDTLLQSWQATGIARLRLLGRIEVVNLKGHPTRADLKAGTKKGVPVSIHNVHVDRLCREAGQTYLLGRSNALAAVS